MSKDLIEPRLPSGFKDLDPQLALARQKMINIIDQQYRLIGSLPLETPAVEYEEVLIGGEDFSKQLYRVVRRSGAEEEKGHPVALRFDLTVPLARYLSEHPETPMPFIRHQVGQVWRGERPQKGRYREFTQFDLDIVGSASLAADAQIIATMYNVMCALGIKQFMIKYNNRKLLNGIFDHLKIDKVKRGGVLRTLDKLERDGQDKVKSELRSDLFETSPNKPEELMSFISIGDLSELKEKLQTSPVALEAINELNQLAAYIKELGVPPSYCKFDTTIIRGLGYYTGPVWETALLDVQEFGNVYSGGRYDDLMSRFSKRALPATGTSIGVDRLLAAMEKINLLKNLTDQPVSVFIPRVEENLDSEYLKFTATLRSSGISTEYYLGKEKGLKQQLGYAESRGAKVAVIYGQKEKDQGVVQIKNLANREQKEIKISELVTEVQKILS